MILVQQQQQQQQQPTDRNIQVEAERDHSLTSLSLALSPVLTTGYYSESLSQSVSQSVSQSAARRVARRSTPPPAPLAPRDEGVVIEAGMSFVLGHKTVRSSSVSAIGTGTAPPKHHSSRRTGVRQHFRPVPAHAMNDTSSSALTRAIREFLGRTDHVINEWNSRSSEIGNNNSKWPARSRSSTRSSSDSYAQRRYSTRSLSSSGRYSSSDTSPHQPPGRVGSAFSRAPSFQSIRSIHSDTEADTDFGSCQDLNDYPAEVFFFSHSISVRLFRFDGKEFGYFEREIFHISSLDWIKFTVQTR